MPVAPACAHIAVKVHFSNNKYILKGYVVEGKKQLYPPDFPFNEAWLDKIVAMKARLRASLNLVGVDLVGGSEFLKMRLPAKTIEKAAARNDKEGGGETEEAQPEETS